MNFNECWLYMKRFGRNAICTKGRSPAEFRVHIIFICLTTILLFVSVLNSTFKVVLPDVDLIDVLNDDSIPSSYTIKGKVFNYTNDLLLAKLDNVYKTQEKEYLEQIGSMILMLQPTVVITPNDISIELREGRYLYRSGLVEYPQAGVRTVFSESIGKNRYKIGFQDHNIEFNHYIQQVIYPLYHSSSESIKSYNIDSILPLLTTLRFSSCISFIVSFFLMIPGMMLLCSLKDPYENSIKKKEEYRIQSEKIYYISKWPTWVILFVIYTCGTLNAIVLMIICSRFKGTYMPVMCLANWFQLLYTLYANFYYLGWGESCRRNKFDEEDFTAQVNPAGEELQCSTNESPKSKISTSTHNKNMVTDEIISPENVFETMHDLIALSSGDKSIPLSLNMKTSRSATPESLYSESRGRQKRKFSFKKMKTAPINRYEDNQKQKQRATSAPFVRHSEEEYQALIEAESSKKLERCESRFQEEV